MNDDNPFDDYGDDAGLGTEGPTNEQLANIIKLGQDMLAWEIRIARGEERLREWKDEHRNLQQKVLPAAMIEAGLTDFTLANGAKLKVEPFLTGNVLEENRPMFFDWLEENGHGGLIKRTVVIPFKMNEDSLAETLKENLTEQFPNRPVEYERTVAAQTLKKFIREMREQGKQLPECVRIVEFPQAVVVPAKKKVTGL